MPGHHIRDYPGKPGKPFQIEIPTNRAGGTGGREYFNAARIERIRQMAAFGKFDSEPEELQQFLPIQDLKDGETTTAPYTFEERLIVVPSNSQQFTGTVDSSLHIGDFRMSAPIIVGEYSYGAMRKNVHIASAEATDREELLFGIGEGGWYTKIRDKKRIMVQVASGLFGITAEILQDAAIISIKMAQSAKAGIGGHVVAEKIDDDMAETRGMPKGIDYISDANRIFSIEELRQIVSYVRKASRGKPILIKCAATHDIRAIVAGAIAANSEGIIIDGRGGGTGAGPIIWKNSSCIPIELAIPMAYEQATKMGVAGKFRIIAAGRVDLPRKAFKLMLEGADATMLGSAAVVSMGCGMVHRCHKICPALLATKIGDREVDPEWGAHVLSSYLRVFNEELKRYAAFYGFSSLSELVGKKSMLRAIAFGPDALELTGIEKAEGRENIERELEELWHREYDTPLQIWQTDHNEVLAETGVTEIGSMGRTTDLDPPKSILDRVIVEGRHVVGPSFDKYRDVVETTTRLEGNIRLGTPFTLAPANDPKNQISCLKTAVSRRTVARITQKMIAKIDAELVLKKELEKRTQVILFEIGNEKAEDVIDRTNHRVLREAAGIIVPESFVTPEALSTLRTWTDRPIYAKINADGLIVEKAIKLALVGVNGLLVEGEIGLRKFEIGKENKIPLEIAIPLLDNALAMKLLKGRPLRKNFRIIASGNIRGPDDAFKIMALGADAIESTVISGVAGENDFENRIKKLVDGYTDELKVIVGADGLSGTATLIANRNLLRADEMPEDMRKLLGIEFMGK
ncbi:MAG: glutamate synthase-related protein [Candidatus Micrarchaeota archaeon]|nr:glutamate synthase-related protein [Candidatus Micrarchaeota archaeon]